MKPEKKIKQNKKLEESNPRSEDLPPKGQPAGNVDLFRSMVSQDFSIPLAVITDCCREIHEIHSGKLSKQCKEAFHKIYDEINKMNMQVESLSLLQPQHRTHDYVQTELVDLGAIARVIIDRLMWTKPERRVKFIVALDMMAGCDASLLQIALKHLLSNAWKCTANNPETLIEFGITKLERETAFFVRDNGEGYDIADMDSLFDPPDSCQLQNDVVIGLDIVKNIIHRHSGRVWAEGNAGPGSTFYFTLQQHKSCNT